MLVPILLLALFPLGYFAARTGAFGNAWARRGFLAATVVTVLAVLPDRSLDFTHVKRLNLFIAAATALILVLRQAGVGWLRDRARYLRALGALAAIAAVTYMNFLSFHGEKTWVHYHDVAHYYLGSKYFRELGYGDLYTAMLRAEAEVYSNRFKTIEARDLHSGEIVHIRGLLQSSDPVKAAFTPERWEAFKTDVTFFREALGTQYGTVYQDHGFNPTPLWAVTGGFLANLVPAGSATGIFLLTLIDPALILAAFAAVFWAFGLETALLAAIHFCVIFGAGFGWTGGAFLRFLWFFGVVAGFAALAKGRHATAGALLALATVLRIFPAFFAAGLLFKAIGDALMHGGIERGYRRFFVAFGLTAALLGGLTLAVFDAGAWGEFRRNMDEHRTTVSPNMVGLTGLLAYQQNPPLVTQEELRGIRERRERIYRAQLMTVFALAVLACAAASAFLDDVAAAALGAPLVFVGLNLASYYYALLVVLVLAHRGHPRRLALVFTAEAVSHVAAALRGARGAPLPLPEPRPSLSVPGPCPRAVERTAGARQDGDVTPDSPLALLRAARARIDLDRLAANYDAIRAAAGLPVMPVVKADAYGHGAAAVGWALVEKGAPCLAVAYVEEGVALRQSGVTIPIVVLAGFAPRQAPVLAPYDLTPVVSTPQTLAALIAHARDGARRRAHVKADTGMGRLGFATEAFVEAALRLRDAGIEVEGAMTHLASADEDAGVTAASWTASTTRSLAWPRTGCGRR